MFISFIETTLASIVHLYTVYTSHHIRSITCIAIVRCPAICLHVPCRYTRRNQQHPCDGFAFSSVRSWFKSASDRCGPADPRRDSCLPCRNRWSWNHMTRHSLPHISFPYQTANIIGGLNYDPACKPNPTRINSIAILPLTPS